MPVILISGLENRRANFTIISSNISYMSIKFFLIASSVSTPQKSLITYTRIKIYLWGEFTLQTLAKTSMRKDGDPLVLVVHTKNSPFFFI